MSACGAIEARIQSADRTRSRVHIVNVTTGQLKCLSDGNRDETVVDWTASAGLVIDVVDGDDIGVEFMDPETGRCKRVLEDASTWQGETRDGKAYLYFRKDSPGLWRRSLADGRVSLEISAEMMAGWNGLVAESDFTYYTFSFRDGVSMLLSRYDTRTRENNPLLEMGGFGVGAFVLSPDGRRMLYHRANTRKADLITVPDFKWSFN